MTDNITDEALVARSIESGESIIAIDSMHALVEESVENTDEEYDLIRPKTPNKKGAPKAVKKPAAKKPALTLSPATLALCAARKWHVDVYNRNYSLLTAGNAFYSKYEGTLRYASVPIALCKKTGPLTWSMLTEEADILKGLPKLYEAMGARGFTSLTEQCIEDAKTSKKPIIFDVDSKEFFYVPFDIKDDIINITLPNKQHNPSAYDIDNFLRDYSSVLPSYSTTLIISNLLVSALTKVDADIDLEKNHSVHFSKGNFKIYASTGKLNSVAHFNKIQKVYTEDDVLQAYMIELMAASKKQLAKHLLTKKKMQDAANSASIAAAEQQRTIDLMSAGGVDVLRKNMQFSHLPNVESVKFNVRNVIVTTKDVWSTASNGKHGKMPSKYLGKYEIALNLMKFSILVRNIAMPGNAAFTTSGHSNIGLCLGDYDDLINDAMATFNMEAVIATVLAFVHDTHITDHRGRSNFAKEFRKTKPKDCKISPWAIFRSESSPSSHDDDRDE